ncbi:MAG: trigger factor [Sandaracinaceae bacterium]
MQSQLNEIDPVTIELSVEVPWDRVEQGLNAGYQRLQKTAKLRGFRPGKVPRQVLRKLFGNTVQSEVVGTLIEEGLLAAVREHSLAVVASPRVDELPSIVDGEPLSFKATLEVRPKVDAVNTEGLVLERPVITVPDSDVDEQIEKLRQSHADIITPDEPRPAKKGDLLTIDFTVEIDAEERADMAASGRVVELGSDRLLPEFEEGLTGKTAGDEVQIRVAYGDDVTKEDLRGKRALFKVKINELREKVLPDLDDDFAQDVGDHQTLDELRTSIRERLQASADRQAEGALREQAIEQLVEKNPIPVPPSLIREQEESMRQELAYYMRLAGQDAAPPAMDFSQEAEKKVRAAMLLGEIARLQEIRVSPDEIEARLAKIAEESGKHIAKVRVDYKGERLEALENKLLEEKLLEYLLAQATVRDAAPPSDAAAPNETVGDGEPADAPQDR